MVPSAFKHPITKGQKPVTLLAADIGGTKTNVAIYQADENGLTMGDSKRYVSKDHSSLTDIIKDFTGGKLPDRIAAAVAGPVVDGKSKLTNLPWQLDSAAMREKLKVSVCFINDLEATAYGLAGLKEGELATLAAGD